HVHGKKVLIVINTTVAPLYLDKLIEALTSGNPNISVESVILPNGEHYKDMFSEFPVLLEVGGDIMIDSSVGGNIGINHLLEKTIINDFYQPQYGLIDINTLNTLLERELASGFAKLI
ncbi:hypothetical protein RYX36_014022, partial [Vicia faba]